MTTAPLADTALPSDPWWLGDALRSGPQGLELDGVPLAGLAARHGTPLYVYGSATIRRRLEELRSALRSTGAPFRIRYAMKANRFGPVLELLRGEGEVGIDACSPREVERALGFGFRTEEITVTAGMLSNRDLATFARQGVHLNLDTLSVLRRWAATPGRSPGIGLRLDPAVRVGWGENPKHSYGDSKFGFAFEAAAEAAAYAASLGLVVDTLHIHSGWGMQQSAAPLLAGAFARLAALARTLPTVQTLNVGGGLCWRQRAEDQPLSPATWAGLLREHLAPTGCTIACEPGTFLVASSGVLLAEVNTVEQRPSGTWLGIDAGHNVNVYAAHYGIPLAIAGVARPTAPATREVHLAGNINEANDIFGRSLLLPELAEGELVALYPTGAYGASMASDHCMRRLPAEVLV